jgi:hypothetical protein
MPIAKAVYVLEKDTFEKRGSTGMALCSTKLSLCEFPTVNIVGSLIYLDWQQNEWPFENRMKRFGEDAFQYCEHCSPRAGQMGQVAYAAKAKAIVGMILPMVRDLAPVC